MTPAFDLAISELKKASNPIDKIKSSSAYWIPLQWVYSEMVKNKDMVMLSMLPEKEKQRFWDMVKNLDKPKWVKVQVAQAIYVYEFLNK